jgi:xylan 1,4-beta-xylosidase
MKKACALTNMRIVGCLLASAMPVLAQRPASPPETTIEPARAELRTITIDASSNMGQLKPLRGVNAGPLPWTDRLGIDRPGGEVEVSDRTGYRSLGADASAGYRSANIDLVRVHDNYGPGDIYTNFKGSHEMADGTILSDALRNPLVMFPDLQADPNASTSYNFGPTDRLIKSIYDVGAHPLFRLGASAGESSGVPDSFTTEDDYDHYADIARHVVLHYNAGWNHGFRYGIKYWEVLNEPDGRFTPAKYYKLYGKLARAVKAADPTALIGGPALMFAYQGPTYREDFLEYLRKNNLPLDFWSFHDYCIDSADPYYFVRESEDMRKLLDTHGFVKTQLILDEWNLLGINPELLTMAGRAAFTTSAIIYMQDSPLDAQTFYMGPNLFGEDGKTPNKVGQALIALGQMKHTPVRLAVTGADTQGLAALAGRSTDGTEINVLISNYEVPASLRGARKGGDKVAGYINLLPRRELKYQPNGGFDLKVTSLKPDQLYRVERYRINDDWDYRLLNTTTVKGREVTIIGALRPPDIELIVIKSVAQ